MDVILISLSAIFVVAGLFLANRYHETKQELIQLKDDYLAGRGDLQRMEKQRDHYAKEAAALQESLQQLKETKKNNSYEVTELLHDLTAGRALIEVKRIAPSDFFLRSPRGDA